MIVDSIPLGVFSVGDRVTDDLERTKLVTKAMLTRVNRTDILEEDLEDTTGLIVDKTGDTLHTATASETTDSLWLVTMVVSPLPLSQTKTTSDDVRAW